MGQDQRPTRVRYIVLLGLCLAAGLAYVHRTCLPFAASTIRADVGLSDKQLGLVMGVFFWTYALFQIPTGMLTDRWGPRRALFLFGIMGALTLALAAGTLFLGAVLGFIVLLTSRALMGVAQAGLFPASTRCFGIWFPVRQRGLATGTLQSCMSVGAFASSLLTPWVLGMMYWPYVFITFAIPGVIWSLWFHWYFRDRPPEHPSINAGELEQLKLSADAQTEFEARGPTPWLRLFTDSKVIWICAQQFFRAMAFGFWMTWCPTFFQNVYLLNIKQAGLLAGIPFIGSVLGAFGGGLIADWVLVRTGSKTWSRKGVSMITTALGVALFAIAYADPPRAYVAMTGAGNFAAERTFSDIPAAAWLASGLLFLAAFFSMCGSPCAYSVTIDIGGRYMAVVFGAMNMLGNFGTALFPVMAPFWVESLGWATLPLFVGGLNVLGFLCWVPLNPNGKVLEAPSAEST